MSDDPGRPPLPPSPSPETPSWPRRSVLTSGAAGVAAALLTWKALPGVAAPRPGNVLMILADDHRADAMSWAGHPVVRTPYLDALASRSLRFTRAFSTTALCSPSRAAMLTGLYGFASGVQENLSPLPANSQTVMRRMEDAGVQTALVGKWGLDAPGSPSDAAHWFQSSLALRITSEPMDAVAFDNGNKIRLSGYTDDLLTARAVEVLRRLSSTHRPWFLLLALRAPHAPWVPSPARSKDYQGMPLPPVPQRNPSPDAPAWVHRIAQGGQGNGGDGSGDTPRSGRRGGRGGAPPGGRGEEAIASRQDPEVRRLQYLRCVAGVDDCVGKVLSTLKGLPGEDRTTVIYTSDNGMMQLEQGIWEKRVAYEPSIRIPLLIQPPSRLSGSSPREVRNLVLNTDLAPTLLAMTGTPLPPGFGRHGASLLPFIEGDNPSWRTDFFYHYGGDPGRPTFPATHAVRDFRWKYIETAAPSVELYDLEQDPSEAHNLAADPASQPIRTRLAGRLAELRTSLESPPLPAPASP